MKQPSQPRVSVPPNVDVSLQWVAWLVGSELHHLVRNQRSVSSAAVVKLEHPDYQIIPPLLLNLAKNESIEGVDVVLYRSIPDTTRGRLVVKHLLASNKPGADEGIDIQGPAPVWATTVYLADGDRHTFFLSTEKSRSALKASNWAHAKAITAPQTLTDWEGRAMAGAAWFANARIVGACLLQKGNPQSTTYSFHKWRMEGTSFTSGDEINIAWPETKPIDLAILRVSAAGAPFALLRGARDGKWYFCVPTGDVTALTGPAEKMRTPADILFRGGSDPTIMYADPGRGFQFAKPD